MGTGVSLAIPEGYAGLVLPRSGLAVRHGVSLVNTPGLIDSGYRGEIRVPLINHDREEAFRVEPGMRIAQLVLVRAAGASFEEVEFLDASADGRGRAASAPRGPDRRAPRRTGRIILSGGDGPTFGRCGRQGRVLEYGALAGSRKRFRGGN